MLVTLQSDGGKAETSVAALHAALVFHVTAKSGAAPVTAEGAPVPAPGSHSSVTVSRLSMYA